MPKDGFALLIGKKLDEKEKGKKKDGPLMEMPDSSEDGSMDDTKDESSQMEDSAVADLLQAIETKSVPAAKQALKDFIELCYEKEEKESPEEESAEPELGE